MSEQQQINTLLYCMSQDAKDILQTTWISWAERDKYDSVIERLDKHFGVMKNVVYEWARFNTRRQQHRETGHHYILAFYMLAVNCNYGATQEQEICDYLIISIRDVKQSQSHRWIASWHLKMERRKYDRMKLESRTKSWAALVLQEKATIILLRLVLSPENTIARREDSSWANTADGTWSTILEKLHCVLNVDDSHAECPARRHLPQVWKKWTL